MSTDSLECSIILVYRMRSEKGSQGCHQDVCVIAKLHKIRIPNGRVAYATQLSKAASFHIRDSGLALTKAMNEKQVLVGHANQWEAVDTVASASAASKCNSKNDEAGFDVSNNLYARRVHSVSCMIPAERRNSVEALTKPRIFLGPPSSTSASSAGDALDEGITIITRPRAEPADSLHPSNFSLIYRDLLQLLSSIHFSTHDTPGHTHISTPALEQPCNRFATIDSLAKLASSSKMVVHVLDNFYLSITFLISLGWQLLGFAIAFGLQIDTITDFWSAANAIFLAIFTLCCGDQYYARNVIASIFVIMWGVRLGAFQLFRMIKMGGDSRFDEMRSKPLSFLGFWTFQLVWVWTITMPVTVLNSPNSSDPAQGGGNARFGNGKDVVGIIFFAVGFVAEALADIQKYRFKSVTKPPKGAITDAGIWKYSRRPNYFGEIMLWWGVWLLALGNSTEANKPGHDALYGSIFSPLITMALLLFLSGIPLAEKPTQQKYFLMSHGPDKQAEGLEPWHEQTETDPWDRMKAFRERTSILFPLPNGFYKRLPKFVKSTVLFDFPFYNFDETKDGTKAIREAEHKKNSDNP